MNKKAYLVTFSITTRVVAEEDDDYAIDQAAVERILEEPSGYICRDNITEVDEDIECPYYPEEEKIQEDD